MKVSYISKVEGETFTNVEIVKNRDSIDKFLLTRNSLLVRNSGCLTTLPPHEKQILMIMKMIPTIVTLK